MAGDAMPTASSSSCTPSFTAPEGTYIQTMLSASFGELPLSSHAAQDLSANPSSGSSSSPLGASSLLLGPGATLPVAASSLSPTAPPQSPDGSTLTAPPPPMPISHLPLSWRREVGPTVEPSLSTCSIPWSSALNLDAAASSSKRKGDSADGSGAATESSAGSSNGRQKGAAPTAMPNPLIEGALVSQGIDAPAATTTGGVGGILGMSALASYAFLPGSNQVLDLDRQLSLLSVRSETGPASLYKPQKNAIKPKNAVRQSNSSFVVKTQIHPDLKDVLAHEPIEPMVFTQRGRTLLWLADASGKREPLGRFLFASPPSAHDVNQLTRSPTTLDVIVGFPTGDILWLDAIGMRYSRFNKGGLVTDSGVTQIRWLPNAMHQGLFMTAHADGTMIVWDREREDCEVNKGWAPKSWSLAPTRKQQEAMKRLHEFGAGADGERERGEMEVLDGPPDSPIGPSAKGASPSTSNVNLPDFSMPANAWDPKRSILVSRPGVEVSPVPATPTSERGPMLGSATPGSLEDSGYLAPPGAGSTVLGRGLGSQRRRDTPGQNAPDDADNVAWTKNPLTHWRVSQSRINDFAISPDLGCVAVAGEDGLLRIIDLASEKLIASHSSYFGPFLSLAWSPDGRFLLTTSCDDLVSIYHPRDSGGGHLGSESRLVARCVGHSSWVRDVAFDPYRWREGDRTYRFGSVGEDGKVLLWDFSSASLSRPKHTVSTRRGARPSSAMAMANHGAMLHRHRSKAHIEGGVGNEASDDTIYHAAPPRQQVAQLNPISSYQVSNQSSILGIRFRPTDMLLFHANGMMQIFERPTVKLLRIGNNDGAEAAEGAGRGGAEGDATKSKKRTGVSFGGTLSRGMRWVGGGQQQQQQAQQQQSQPQAGSLDAQARSTHTNTAALAMLG